MRTSLLALLAVAFPLAAAVPTSPDLLPVAVVTAEAPMVSESTRPAARVVIKSSKVVVASVELRDADGRTVRTYDDALLWRGKTVLTLDLGGLRAGLYDLVVTTPRGSEAMPFRVS